MTRPRLWSGLRLRWRWAAIMLLAVVALTLWSWGRRRALVVASRIGYSLLLALPPVLLIAAGLAAFTFYRRRGRDGTRPKRPPPRRR